MAQLLTARTPSGKARYARVDLRGLPDEAAAGPSDRRWQKPSCHTAVNRISANREQAHDVGPSQQSIAVKRYHRAAGLVPTRTRSRGGTRNL